MRHGIAIIDLVTEQDDFVAEGQDFISRMMIEPYRSRAQVAKTLTCNGNMQIYIPYESGKDKDYVVYYLEEIDEGLFRGFVQTIPYNQRQKRAEQVAEESTNRWAGASWDNARIVAGASRA